MAKGPRQIVKDVIVKPIKTAAAAGFSAATLTAASLMNPGSTPKVTSYYADPNGEGDFRRYERYQEIPNPVPPMDEIARTAADYGVKAALVVGGVHLGRQIVKRNNEMKEEGIHPALRQDQFNPKKFKKIKY